jgi:hypothetical protein
MKNLAFWMELNTPMKILAFCILSFQSSWYFAFCIPWGTKHSLSRISSSVSTWSLLTVQCWSDSTSALNIFISDINPLLLRSDILIQLLESGKLCVVAYTFILYVSERVTSFFCQTLFKFCEIPDLEAWSDYHFYPFKSQQLSYSSTAGVVLLNVLFSQAF